MEQPDPLPADVDAALLVEAVEEAKVVPWVVVTPPAALVVDVFVAVAAGPVVVPNSAPEQVAPADLVLPPE